MICTIVEERLAIADSVYVLRYITCFCLWSTSRIFSRKPFPPIRLCDRIKELRKFRASMNYEKGARRHSMSTSDTKMYRACELILSDRQATRLDMGHTFQKKEKQITCLCHCKAERGASDRIKRLLFRGVLWLHGNARLNTAVHNLDTFQQIRLHKLQHLPDSDNFALFIHYLLRSKYKFCKYKNSCLTERPRAPFSYTAQMKNVA